MSPEESLSRARGNFSMANFAQVIQEFCTRGIPASEIRPKENVFTFNAWKALGRVVKKGEKGVKILTWIPMETKDGKSKVRPWTSHVFHVSQTEELQAK